MRWAVRLWVVVLVTATAGAAWACEPPVPPPTVPFVWAPTCLMVRADEPDPDSVVGGRAVELLTFSEGGGGGPFSGEVVHPLGFSASSAFAWLRLHPEGAWTLRVVELVGDKELDRIGDRDDEDQTLMGVIGRNRGAILSLLGKHEIAPSALPVHLGSATLDGRLYRVRFEQLDQAEAATVWLDAEGLGTKRLGVLDQWTACAMCGTPRGWIVASPHEPRAAVIVSFRGPRFESDIPEIHHSVFGAHLTERFEGAQR